MRTGVILASTQADKNALLYAAVRRYAGVSEVINFGCGENEPERYSYVEVSLLVGLLLTGGAVDFVVTGCSSGQGMMLACNSFPGVLCGYAPSPMDAYFFAQINNGNAISLPLGEGYTWKGLENLEKTIEKLFSEPFAQGYPKGEAGRKLKDTAVLKDLRRISQVDKISFLDRLDAELIKKLMTKRDVVAYILEHGTDMRVLEWMKARGAVCGV